MAEQSPIISDGLIIVERGGNEYLGVDTGIPANSPSLRKLAGRQRQTGWLVRNGAMERWRALGFVERNGRVHVYGPLVRGRFLADVLEDESADRLAALEVVATALTVLENEGATSFAFHTRTVILLDDGGVLIMPPDIMQAIREHQDYAARIARMERFNHPDRKPEDNTGFAIAASAYFIITGAYPFDSDDEEELHARVRAASPIPASYRDVTIRDEVSSTLQRELTAQESGMTTAEWVDVLRAWRASGVRTELDDEQRRRREQTAEQAIARLEEGFRRRELVRKHGRTALVVAVVVILVGTIPGTIIRNALAPRATADLPPEEVVRTFYTSINSLDHMTMEDAVVDDAGKPLIREVTNLFVMDRQRMSVEMESGFVDAQQWRDSGMPTLSDGKSPYGVANLELEALEAPEGERRYEADYERWLPDYEQAELTGRAGIMGRRIVDIVSLRRDRDDWVIYEIDQRSEEEIDLDELRADSDDAA
ncbi:MAG: hypothetical protein ACOCW3_00270 [Spirochaetota bacterium]